MSAISGKGLYRPFFEDFYREIKQIEAVMRMNLEKRKFNSQLSSIGRQKAQNIVTDDSLFP
ncbi:hypothetical protein BET10_14630 [Pseudoalteromonas amylolytica]|uniref:Uncharacterized protein n=1 Tax=Pseudoalteromonas amylolytica TaxID=1859457 RepID=A0A1S1MT28_9GAMM|nr:hypothetical protein BFC16_20345 [Pseudoalteromonas sp. JW3]OHU90012.1 hypothetical protein BET10_14630 [Pseudoalteromonas amylolytica]